MKWFLAMALIVVATGAGAQTVEEQLINTSAMAMFAAKCDVITPLEAMEAMGAAAQKLIGPNYELPDADKVDEKTRMLMTKAGCGFWLTHPQSLKQLRTIIDSGGF